MALWNVIRRCEQRQGRDLDRTVLAQRANISPSSLYAYLKGRTLLRSTTLDRLLDELKASPAEKRELASLREAVETTEQRERTADGRRPSGLPTPRQLPPAVRGFAGRAAELRALDAMLAGADPGVPLIVVIHGTPGVGKTTLALCWAHRLKDRYPDGQLHVNLRGFDAEQAPDPGQALDGLLQALGAAPESVPCELDAKTALFRSFMDDRRMLLVLDNARSAEFVRPLLPSTGGTLVIVTSRNQMDGLVVREGAHRIGLGVLPYREALALLERRLGAPRLAAEASAADELVELCARLPLALSVSATKVGASLETFVHRTRDVHDRLAALGSHESDLDLRTVFHTSYTLLPGSAARLFRLLGLHAGPDIDAYACAALLDDDVPAAHAALSVLAAANLVGEQPGARFGSHDLLRAFARSLADDTPPDDRRASVSRLLDHYLGTAVHAGRHVQMCRTEDLPRHHCHAGFPHQRLRPGDGLVHRRASLPQGDGRPGRGRGLRLARLAPGPGPGRLPPPDRPARGPRSDPARRSDRGPTLRLPRGRGDLPASPGRCPDPHGADPSGPRPAPLLRHDVRGTRRHPRRLPGPSVTDPHP